MIPSEFAKAVVEAFENKRGVFERHVNAENFVPKNLTPQEQALFLFYVVQLDYAMKSSRLYEGALKLVEDEPDFFQPQAILKLSGAQLREILGEYLKPRYINEAVMRYRVNSKKLIDEYAGDPLKIVESSTGAQKFLKRVREFRGFGPKIGNFFVRAMVNFFRLEFDDIETILPPVDVHDVNIAYLMSYIDSREMTTSNIKEVKNIWSRASHEVGLVGWCSTEHCGFWDRKINRGPRKKF